MVHYSDYLQLDKILQAQELESDKLNMHAHDEMLFIIIHQAYELWFKQILFEVGSCIELMDKGEINDNSPDLHTIVHRLSRVSTILKVAVHQIDILETMTPMDFLDFRDFLRPASGFQSWQFKLAEAKLGLRFEDRFGKEYYTSQLRQEQVDLIKNAEKEPSLLELVEKWLERMPFFDDAMSWESYTPIFPVQEGRHIFWSDYAQLYQQGLVEGEQQNYTAFEQMFFGEQKSDTISPKAARAALFINLYRDYPLLQMPYHLIFSLLEIDEQLSTWRYRHVSMVTRMIGGRVGTGGSTGKSYLKGALDKHYIFRDFAALSSFLLDRRRVPGLSKELEKRLGF